MEAIGLVVAFIAGVLVDHFLLNKLAGYVSEGEAELKARLAALESALGLHPLTQMGNVPPLPEMHGDEANAGKS